MGMLLVSRTSRVFARCISPILSCLNFPFRVLSSAALWGVENFMWNQYSHLGSQVDGWCLLTYTESPVLSLCSDHVMFCSWTYSYFSLLIFPCQGFTWCLFYQGDLFSSPWYLILGEKSFSKFSDRISTEKEEEWNSFRMNTIYSEYSKATELTL